MHTSPIMKISIHTACKVLYLFPSQNTLTLYQNHIMIKLIWLPVQGFPKVNNGTM